MSRFYFTAIFLVSFTANLVNGDDYYQPFPLGIVKGKKRTTITGVTVYSFQGIPYAEPPTGEYRFRSAKPKEPWTDILDATQERSFCLQMTSDTVAGSEDCLFMNIFSPKDPSSSPNLPVMVYIYGGGFIEGTSEDVNIGPDHLMNYDVVYVTFNYRVGPFGFFSTGDEVIPGNYGLKDQLEAIKFVKNYIQYFGGNPEKITIFGQSAGSASVQYQLLSPKARGLFRGAICESGSAISAWAYQSNQTEISYLLASLLNPSLKNASSTEVYQYMKQLPAEQIDRAAHIIQKMEKPSDNQIQQGFYFAPVIEPEHDDAFLTQSMFRMFLLGTFNTEVKIMVGVNSEENLFYVSNMTNLEQMATEITADSSILIPRGLRANESKKAEIANKIKEFYSPYLPFSLNWRSLIKYFSDQSFARSLIKSAELQSRWTDVWFYEFAFHGVLGGYTEESVDGFSEDVRHGEEMSFILRRNYGGLNTTDLSKYPEIDQLVQKRVITMWTNFAKYLNPTPEPTELLENIIWPTVKPEDFKYLAIGSWLEVKTNPKLDMYMFWNEIFYTYGAQPFISW
ncbi:juvenile hormone esterase-like [Diorhabda sublineata]|uniref:juvenile hormone esterase-like n=1 Tax=Diorhabda sublineata TaxID=1163346 RepID=UPI0024E1419A|nr:juvenile hormone esterase-like [Diorhabda sublineata]